MMFTYVMAVIVLLSLLALGGRFAGAQVCPPAVYTNNLNGATVFCPADNILPAPDSGSLFTSQGWRNIDIGDQQDWGQGWAFHENRKIRITAAGRDIWNSADGMHFVYRSANDTWFRASVLLSEFLTTNRSNWCKSGLMIRETLAANSKHFLVMHGARNDGSEFMTAHVRTSTNGGTSPIYDGHTVTPTNGFNNAPAPHWMRITREGQTFYGEYSTDSSLWTEVWRTQLSIGRQFYWGLAGSATSSSFTNRPGAFAYDAPAVIPHCSGLTCPSGNSECIRTTDAWPDTPGSNTCQCLAGWSGPDCDILLSTGTTSTPATTGIIGVTATSGTNGVPGSTSTSEAGTTGRNGSNSPTTSTAAASGGLSSSSTNSLSSSPLLPASTTEVPVVHGSGPSSTALPLIPIVVAAVACLCCCLLLGGLVRVRLSRSKHERELVAVSTDGQSTQNGTLIRAVDVSGNYARIPNREPVYCGIPSRQVTQGSIRTLIAEDILVDPSILLGKGAFGSVFRGQFEGAAIAVKMLHDTFTPAQLSSFYDEIETISKIPAHENVVSFIGAAPEPFMLVMELCENGSLKHYLRRRDVALTVEQGIKVMRQIACGMAHLASHSIVHRDLAARNVLLTGDLTTRISDFGMSRQMDDSSEHFSKTSTGPVKWMACESLKTGVCSEKSDVWAFAVTAWEVFNGGAEPYGKEKAIVAVRKVLEDGLRLEYPTKLPLSIQQLFARCMRVDPNSRPTFVECIAEFDEYAASAGNDEVVYASLTSFVRFDDL